MRDLSPLSQCGGEFEKLATSFAQFIGSYWQRLESLPVLSRVKPGEVFHAVPAHPPEQGFENGLGDTAAWDAVFADIERVVLPGLTNWQSPNFYAYFCANISPPAIMGELLSAGLGVQGMLWATSPACTEVEMRMMDWMAEALGLPREFTHASGVGGGVIHGTASEAVLTALVAARKRALAGVATNGGDVTAARGRLTIYASNQAHSSVIKAAMIAGLADSPDDRRCVRLIDVDERFSMQPDALEAAMRADLAKGLVPCFVCATVGTTGTTAIDPVEAVADVIGAVLRDNVGTDLPSDGRNLANIPWVHVDAAHAGAAAVAPEFHWILDGLDRVDSFAFNPHKWLLTNFDCDCFYVRNRKSLTDAMSITPEYLRNTASESGQVVDFRDWQIPLGRRFRALKLWFVMRAYGLEGLRAFVREHVRLATLFEELVKADPRFEIVAPRVLNLVCFRLRTGDAPTKALMERLNASGRMFLTHTTLPPDGRVCLRMAIGAVETREGHVRAAWDEIRRSAG